jgi:hypothetical protein
VPLNEEARTALSNVTRHRFRANRNLLGRRRIKLSFEAGYTAIDLLDGSIAGNIESTERLQTYLSRVPAYMKQAPKPQPSPEQDIDPSLLEPPPEKKFLNVFPRPLGTVDGPRKAPFFVSANQVPFLRWKKPQPANVSRVLRDISEQRMTRLHNLYHLQDYYIPLAKYEDQWEEILNNEFGEFGGTDRGSRWVRDMELWSRELNGQILQRDTKSGELMQKFMEIVKIETEFAAVEKEQRMQQVREERQTRKTGGTRREEEAL